MIHHSAFHAGPGGEKNIDSPVDGVLITMLDDISRGLLLVRQKGEV